MYEARPIQCSTFPFWQNVISSKADWDREAADCPGIGHGPIVSASDIGERLWQRRAWPPIILDYDRALETIDEDTLLGSTGIVANPDDARQVEEQDFFDRTTHNPG